MASPAARDGEEKPPLDIDAILNRHRVNLARSQKIIERWHPKSQEEIARDNDGKDVVVNFDDLLRPELAGLGADLTPKSSSRVQSSAGEGELGQLRKQLLGRSAAAGTLGSKHGPHKTGQQPQDSNADLKRDRPADAASDDDSEGRSASFRSKRAKKSKVSDLLHNSTQKTSEDNASDNARHSSAFNVGEPQNINAGRAMPEDEMPKPTLAPPSDSDEPPVSSKSISILDQVIAERMKKKNRKKKQKRPASD